MTMFVEEDIGRRALLDILTSVAQTPHSNAGAPPRKKKQRFRPKKRLRDEDAAPSVEAEPQPTCVSIVERLSSETVSVCWSDARMGHCSEQTWRLGRSRIEAFCALTGERIRYGDRIFRPRTQRGCGCPGQGRMILACAVDELMSSRQAVRAA